TLDIPDTRYRKAILPLKSQAHWGSPINQDNDANCPRRVGAERAEMDSTCLLKKQTQLHSWKCTIINKWLGKTMLAKFFKDGTGALRLQSQMKGVTSE
ncbi:hypothetical protein J6590_000731, partial [Homalodisca vitripennis]